MLSKLTLARILGAVLSLTCLTIRPAAARAPLSWVEPIFGFEFTFRSKKTEDFNERWKLIRRLAFKAPWYARFARLPGPISRKSSTVYFGDNSIEYGTDPSVIEVTGTPQTIAGYELYRRSYETLTFDLLARSKLFPDEIIGGGHIHIGRIFVNDPQLLRDFTVDFYNHSSLAIGIFAYNPKQGMPMADHNWVKQVEYLRTIADFDESKGTMTTEEFAKRLVRIQNNRKAALNFDHLSGSRGKQTLEVRISPQKSFGDFLLISKLFRARLSWLKRHQGQPAGVPPGPRSFAEAQVEFRQYVEECGLAWQDYAHFGIASWRLQPESELRTHRMNGPDQDRFMAEVAKIKERKSSLSLSEEEPTVPTAVDCNLILSH